MNIEKCNICHNFKYDYSKVIYINSYTKVCIVCPYHGDFLQNPKNHTNGSGCPKCALLKKSHDQSMSIIDFISRSNQVHNNRYVYDNVSYRNIHYKVCVTCISHGDFLISPTHHLNGVGCSKCSRNYNMTNEEFINRCISVHNNKYNYDLVNFINTKSSIDILCPEHGSFLQNAGHHLYGSGCPKCKASKGEMIIQKYLDDNDIKYLKEVKFNNCLSDKGKSLKFDFYLLDYNCCIEYDGIQHFRPIEYFGGYEAFQITRKNDIIKNNFCKSNGIRLLRISYNSNIINKLNTIRMKKNQNG